ncbi:MAG TPA: DNA polymerase Y family protein [Flavihumibacter sp.]
MSARFVSIWFRHLITDYMTLREPGLHTIPWVVVAMQHGRQVITAANALAELNGIGVGLSLADARAMLPGLVHRDEQAGLAGALLKRMAEWCIRFTPVTAVDEPDGILLNASGCAHLWGGEEEYLNVIAHKFKTRGYDIRLGMAGTIGMAWAVARFGGQSRIVASGHEAQALLSMPPAALRLDMETQAVLVKLGLRQIGQFIQMPRQVLRRRFGEALVLRLEQALGQEEEWMETVMPQEPYSERLPCLEPILTATGIRIALEKLLEQLCARLRAEELGLRVAHFHAYRIDGKKLRISISTLRASNHAQHLFKLFEKDIETLEPDLGIELFVLEAPVVESHKLQQSAFWNEHRVLTDNSLAELMDRLAQRLGVQAIQRYLPAEHHWPERAVQRARRLDEQSELNWPAELRRPAWLQKPEPIEVTAPVPDYPPMNFRYRGVLHTVKKADGPERIEPEWWLQTGEHRDYYIVEDDRAGRYWIFRQGHYEAGRKAQWFLHGFFP